MADNGNSTEPPVPPRRTKRKIKIAPIEPSMARSSATETTNDVAIFQQKRPPPPPPLPEKCRRNNSGYIETRQPQCDTAASCSRAESEQHHRESRVIDTTSGMIGVKPRGDSTFRRGNSTTSNSANTDPIPQSIVSKPPFVSSLDVALSKRKAFDKYPPLFFTLQDFENVVSDTWNKIDSANASFMDPGDSQNLHKEESSKAYMLDDDSDVSFRVTTTNLPFEKCLSKWRDPFDDSDCLQKFDDCRFEGSTNETDRINDKRSSGYDVFDNNDDSKRHVGTKVRFAIESPSSSKRDSNVKIGGPCDNSPSCESILGDEQSAASSVKLTEIQGEYANVKDRCDNTRDKSYTWSIEKGNSVTGEDDPFIPMGANIVDTKLKEIPRTHCDDRNNDVDCEKIHEKDSDLILWNAQASDEILKTRKENIITSVTEKTITSEEYDAKQVDQSNTSSEVTENVHRFIDKNSLETTCRIEEAAKITQRRTHRGEKIVSFLKKTNDDIKKECVAKSEKVFVNESSQNFLNERDDDGLSKNIFTDDLVNKSVKIEQTRLPEENKERSNFFVDSKNNHEIVSPSEDIFAKNVPVKVRRNSFLETMLSDDLTDISMNCTVISAITSMNKELNDLNKSPNKIRKSDTDITTESERSCDFYNMTKIDTKNQKVLKDSKEMKEKIVKISNVKPTLSENKSASDVKNDVLNELLCNFNNIKLKIVSPENNKSATKIGDDENISCRIAINNGVISKEKESPSKSSKKSRNEIRNIPISTKTIDVDNDTIIVEEIVKKENLTKMKIEKKPQDLKNDTEPAINEKVTENKNIEIKKLNKSSCDIKNKIAKDNSKMEIGRNSSGIKSKEIHVKTKIEKTSEGTKSTVNVNREPKKSRDVRVPKTILKKNNVECERQQANQFQKRIPIGAPATMNKIFDSREFKVIADASRKSSLENGKKREKASREIHTRGKEKTDEVIANDEADDDRRRIANRSALALVEDTMSSGDKCAIVRKTTSVNPYNNNDNNRAVTPVANISNDQSFRDVVTITPGKVRSFVKYYEIRGDTTTVKRHSKIIDREKVARHKFTKSEAVPVAARSSQRSEIITEGKETKGGGRNVKSNDCDLTRTSFNKTQSSIFTPRVPEDPLNNPVYKTTKIGSKMTEKYEKNASHMSDKETRAPFPKTGTKKSVQFLGGFTMIHSETFGKNESAETVVDRDTNMWKKKRAPGVPPSRDCDDYQKLVRKIVKSEKPPNAGKDSFRRREAVAQVSEAKFYCIIS